MLYVSRSVGLDDFGVVDTDDNTEEIISRIDIVDAVTKLGLQIEGVHIYYSSFKPRTPKVSFVTPYQLDKYATPLQTKTKVMADVDVLLWGTRITAINLRNGAIKSPVSLRLSDYGDRCEDRLLIGNDASDDHRVTIIVDDNIELSDRSFIWVRSVTPGVMLDIRELSDDYSAEIIYRSFARHSLLADLVIDRPERKSMLLDKVWSK